MTKSGLELLEALPMPLIGMHDRHVAERALGARLAFAAQIDAEIADSPTPIYTELKIEQEINGRLNNSERSS